jgi:hypothetical protein
LYHFYFIIKKKIIMTPTNKKLYAKVKKEINIKIPKNSAYRSMTYIKTYKAKGGTFKEDGTDKPLRRWSREKWKNINTDKSGYPVLRPTIIIDAKKTPLTAKEISKRNLKIQIKRKQLIKSRKNLKPFIASRRRRSKRSSKQVSKRNSSTKRRA